MRHSKDVIEVHRVTAASRDVSDAVMSVKYTPDSSWVALGCSTGQIQFYGAFNNHSATFRPFGLGGKETGLTNINFCREYNDDGDASLYWMSASSSNGLVRAFEVAPGTTYKSIGEVTEEGNEVLATAISPDRRFLVSGGADKVLRVYQITPSTTTPAAAAAASTLLDDDDDDSPSKKPTGGLRLINKIEQGIDEHGAPSIGHGSRIFAIKFLPDSPSTFLSAGWESSVLMYDVRCGNGVPQRQFSGPRISGDAIDVSGSTLACASDRLSNQLQFFDLGSGQKMGDDISFNGSLYGLTLSRRKQKLVAWVSGSKENLVACVDVASRETISRIDGLDEAMFGLDVNTDRPGQLFAAGGSLAAYRITVIE